jgi:hypothetical protein
VVTGYLKARADVGFLDEREIPPSKVYIVNPGTWQRDLFQELGRVLADLGVPTDERAGVAVYVLERLFRRPIFRRELQKANLDPTGLSPLEVTKDEREEARKVLAKTPIRLGPNEPAYSHRGRQAPEKYEDWRHDALLELVLTRFNAHAYMLRGKQVTLGEV